MSKVLIVKNVTKVFSNRAVLDNVSFAVERKEIFAIIGASGSGKTTLLKMLIGFEIPNEGAILFQPNSADQKKETSIDINRQMGYVRKNFGYAAQEASFYPKLTVAENMYYFASLYGLSRRNSLTNINTLLDLLDLQSAKSQLAENLSGGMQKRLDIACALIHDPEVLLLDEPTADLDPFLRKQMWELIRKINKRGTTVIISSHFLEDIEAICDTIGILHKGSMEHVGSPKIIKAAYASNDEIFLETKPGKYEEIKEELEKLKHAKIKSIEAEAGRIIIKTTDAECVLHDVLNVLEKKGESLLDLYVTKPSLNDVFQKLEESRHKENSNKEIK